MHKHTQRRLEREAKIRELAGTMPTWKIAETLGYTETSLRVVAQRAGISLAIYHKPFTAPERAYIIEQRAKGVTYAVIAAALGKTAGSVRSLVSHMNLRENR